MKKKKLQVFISSTFTDLIEERQAAVQAVLSSGHIPAGMELFTAGDESQMKVIKRWIEESDVYLLIFGGRYGSIEPTTGKSYTHLEYDYAIELNKPVFAVVITEESQENKVKKQGSSVIETENPQKLNEFRSEVLTRLVKFFNDVKDIKLSVHETMSEFSRREELIGWVRADQDIDAGNLAEEIARLGKENSMLRERLSNIDTSDKFETLGLSINDIIELLKAYALDEDEIPEYFIPKLEGYAKHLGDDEINLFHFFWLMKEDLANAEFRDDGFFDENVYKLEQYGIAEQFGPDYKFTDEGRKFYLKCLVKYPGLVKIDNEFD